MSAPVTEAHRATAHRVNRAETNEEGAEAIADSEARVVAAAVVTLEARITSDEELFHDIRMKLTAACGDPYKLHDEALDAIITERDRLRAEVERLTAKIANQADRIRYLEGATNHATGTPLSQAIARAERAEAEVKRLGHLEAVLRSSAADMTAGSITAGGVADLRAENERLRRAYVRPDDIRAQLESANARAERAEVELANIRALADRRNERDHSQDTTHQLVAALDQAIDIAQAELAAERARLDWLESSAATELQFEGGWIDRAAIDAAMKEGAK